MRFVSSHGQRRNKWKDIRFRDLLPFCRCFSPICVKRGNWRTGRLGKKKKLQDQLQKWKYLKLTFYRLRSKTQVRTSSGR